MITEYIDSQKHVKRKLSDELTKQDKKDLESGKIKFAFYASDYIYYKVIK